MSDNEIIERAPEQPPISPPQISAPVWPFSGPHDKIDDAIAAVTGEAIPIFRGGKNTFQNYKYPRIEDYTEVLAALIAKHKLAIYETATSRNEISGMVYVDYDFYISAEGQTAGPFKVTGQARSRDTKGNFDPAALAKCLTSARKQFYAARFHLKTTDDERETRSVDNARSPIQQPQPQLIDVSKPVELPCDEGISWEDWTRNWLGVINACADLATVERWLDLNETSMDELKGDVPELHAHVMRQYNKRIAALAPGEPS